MPGELLARLADIATAVMAAVRVSGVAATGGSTVRALCERWEAVGIDLLSEVAPGIPLGTVSGGHHDGLPLVTKAGGFGNAGTLVEIVRYLAAGLGGESMP